MSNFDSAIEHVLDLEGGYCNDPLDRGGETKFGITVGVARTLGYDGDMKDLDRDTAAAIYKHDYWNKLMLDKVESETVAIKVFDMAVNFGVKAASRIVQLACKDCRADIDVDGIVGLKTVAIINQLTTGNHELSLLAAMIGRGYNRYMSIIARDAAQVKFLRGWLARLLYGIAK